MSFAPSPQPPPSSIFLSSCPRKPHTNITDETAKPAGQATWDYLPDAVRTAVADVKNVLMSGSFDDAKVVKIDNLQVVIVNAEPGANVNVSSGGDGTQKTGPILQ